MPCNAIHPSFAGVRCRREPGPNARTEGTVTYDDNGNEASRTAGRDVHVHSGKSEDGGTHRWEDVP